MSEGLPSGWKWATVDEVATLVQYGTSAKTSEDPGGVPVLRMGNIVDGRIDCESLKYLPHNHHEFPELLLEDGDMLFNRTNSAELVGKSAVYVGTPSQSSFASYLIRVRLRTGVSPKYLAWYINSSFGRDWVGSVVAQQVGQANVNGSKLRALRYPLAPSPEQNRIVAAIEQHFSDIDAGVSSLQRSLANLKRYRASVLKAACEGQLVPTEAELARREGRSYESGEALLQRFLVEQRASRKQDTRRRQPLLGESTVAAGGHSAPVPEGWTCVRLDRIAEVQLGQQRSPIHAASEKTMPYVRAANITWRGLDLSDVKSMGFPDPERYLLKTGDVLLSEASGSPMEAGKPAIWKGAIPDCCYQKTLLRVRPHSNDVTSEWLFLHFMRDVVAGRFAKMAPGVGIVHLTAERMQAWPFALPPLAEQQRIVAEVDRRLSVADALEATVRTQLARAARLRQSVLKRAFEGRLVPQDPADEPAGALLARIAREAPSAPSSSTRKPRRARAEEP